MAGFEEEALERARQLSHGRRGTPRGEARREEKPKPPPRQEPSAAAPPPATGVEQGETNAILKAKRDDGRWDNVPIRFTVDGNLNVTGEITGPSFITTF